MWRGPVGTEPRKIPPLMAAPTIAAVPRRPKRRSAQSRSLKIAWFLSCLVAVACAAILLLGYAAGYERLYQPWPNGPGTHPLAASAIGLLALGTLSKRPFRRSRLSTVAFFIALWIGLLRMTDLVGGLHMTEHIALFPNVLAEHQRSGFPITFGWNTALALSVAATAGLSQAVRRPTLSQILAIAALAPPVVSAVGYSYGLLNFYGSMSLYSTLLLIAICTAILMSTAHRAFVSVALNNHTAGRLLRHLLLAVLALPLAGGLFVLRMSQDEVPVALLVVCVMLGNVAVALFAMMQVEKLDRARRQRERISMFDAAHDPLTALANRRFFFLAAAREFARAQRYGSKLSVCIFDIDHFKVVNDEFGHAVGDRVLARMGAIVSRSGRAVDIVARYGGEEFVALLPETTEDGAFHWAEKLRLAFKSEIFRDMAGNPFLLTLSAGVSEQRATDDKFEATMHRADKALYAAKNAGRNRTCTVFQTPASPLIAAVRR